MNCHRWLRKWPVPRRSDPDLPRQIGRQTASDLGPTWCAAGLGGDWSESTRRDGAGGADLCAASSPRFAWAAALSAKGYGFKRCRRHRTSLALQRGSHGGAGDSGDRLSQHRWVVARTHAGLAGIDKLRIRFERRLDTHLALLRLACSVICLRFVDRFCQRL